MQVTSYLDLKTAGYSTASGGSTVEIDCATCDGVLLIGVPATTAARTWSMALKTGDTTGTFVNCSSTFTYTSTGVRNDVLLYEVRKPVKRWLGATLSSSAQTPCYLLALPIGGKVSHSSMSSTANVPITSGGRKFCVGPSSAT